MAIKFHIHNKYKNNYPKLRRDPNSILLIANNWDDYSFKTFFQVIVYDSVGDTHDIGSIKIGYKNQQSGWTVDSLDESFNGLGKEFFSLGQSEEFYSKIKSLDSELGTEILKALNDVVYHENSWQLIKDEDVFKYSLLRDISLTSITGQFRRILEGGAIQTEFHFIYKLPKGPKTASLKLEFDVDPISSPPSNIHVIIGRNGVGKTHLFDKMVKSLVGEDNTTNKVGSFFWNPSYPYDDNSSDIFSGVVSVAFSAFDPFDPIPEKKDKSQGIRYSYIGLKRSTNRGGERGTPMSRDMLTNEFVNSVFALISKENSKRWLAAIRGLESDPLFRDLSLSNDFIGCHDEDLKNIARSTFNRLSSGHAIVLLTITKLVEKIEEKTLVFLDEPESHLHPPLLSAFIRTLSDLLSHRNGVAIIATHSPVILQEVPSSCVYKISRSGLIATATRPPIETFGENVGVLTREIFGLEVSESGYHQLIKQELAKGSSYEKILRIFDGHLGSEAKGVLRSLILEMRDGADE
ncbi:AAA family ATPase [Aeromonas dhakensis]|uniref:AAA family ATPase n=1 Tax=Aeromonas dhakensis TaxID=196024 RepID=UPI003BA270EB